MTVAFNPQDLGGDTIASAGDLGVLGSSTITVSDVVSSRDGVDYYRFTLTSAASLQVSLSGLLGSGYVNIYNAQLQEIAYNDASELTPTVLSNRLVAGTYYLAVRQTGDDTPYTASLTATAIGDSATGTSLLAPKVLAAPTTTVQTVSDVVHPRTGPDVYAITLSAAGRLNLSLSGLTNVQGSTIAVRDAAGNFLMQDSADAWNEGGQANGELSALLAAGTYYVTVFHDGTDGVQNYNLSYWTGNPTVGTSSQTDSAGSTLAAARALGTVSTSVSTAEYVKVNGQTDSIDVYSFTTTKLGLITLKLSGLAAGSDAAIELLDGNGNVLGTDYGAGSGFTLASAQRALAAGTYYARVTNIGSIGTGYSLQTKVEALPDAVSNNIASPTSLGTLTATPVTKTDWVGTADPVDYYSFTLTGVTTVSLRLATASNGVYLPYVAIVNGSGNPVYSGNDYLYDRATLGSDGVIVTTLAAGTYKVLVDNGTYGNTGYTLTAQALGNPNGTAGATQATATALGALSSTAISKSDWVGTAAPNDYYSFTLSAASRVLLRSPSVSGDNVRLAIETGDGSVLATLDTTGDNIAQAITLAAGTYYIHGQPLYYDYGNSAYSFAVSATALNGAAKTTQATAGTLSPTSTVKTVSDWVGVGANEDWFKFTLSSAATVNLRGTSIGGGSFYLYDASGSTLEYADLSGFGDAVSFTAGTYYVQVQGNNNDTAYTLDYWTGAPSVGTANVGLTGFGYTGAQDLGALTSAGTTVKGWVGGTTGTDLQDVFKFTVGALSQVRFDLTSPDGPTWLGIWSSTNNEIARFDNYYYDDLRRGEVELTAGTYYAYVTGDSGGSSRYAVTAATVRTLADAAGSTLADATSLGVIGTTATTFSDHLSTGADDVFRFTVGSDGAVTVALTGAGTVIANIYDDFGNSIRNFTLGLDGAMESTLANLTAGEYFLRLSAPYENFDYSLSVSSNAAAVTPAPSTTHDTFASAQSLGALAVGGAGLATSGFVGGGQDGEYFYSFTLDKAATVSLTARDTQASNYYYWWSGQSFSVSLLNANNASQGSSAVYGTDTLKATLAAGTYYVFVDSPAAEHDVRFDLNLTATSADGTAGKDYPGATVLAPSATPVTVADSTGPVGGADYYRITLATAQKLNLRLDAGSAYTGFRLLAADGSYIRDVTDTSIHTTTVSLDAGTYVVRVDNTTEQDAYTLTYSTGTIPLGGSSTDNAGNARSSAYNLGTLGTVPVTLADWVGSSDTLDYYRFTLTGTSAVSLRFVDAGAGNSAPLQFDIQNTSGTVIVDDFNDSRYLSYGDPVLKAGSYYAVVSRTGGNTGYQISASATVLPNAGSNSSAAPTSLGTLGAAPVTVSDTAFSSNDYGVIGDPHDYYSFTLSAVSRVTLRLDGGNLTAVLGGAITEYASAGHPGTFDFIFGPGTYTLDISTGWGSDAYTLSASAVAVDGSAGHSNATATSLGTLTGAGVTKTDWVGNAGGADYYSFTLSSAQRVSFDLDTVSRYAGFEIFRADGTGFGQAFSSDQYLEASGSYDLAAGTYYAVVDWMAYTGTFYGSGTDYRLTARVEPQPGTVTTGATAITPTATVQTLTEWVGEGDASDSFTFTLTQSTVMNFAVQGTGRSLFMRLADSTANQVWAAYGGEANANAATMQTLGAGTYTFSVTYNDGTPATGAAYDLSYWTGAPAIGTSATDAAGNTLATAKSLGAVTASGVTAKDWVGGSDTLDVYSFTLDKASVITLGLAGTTDYVNATIYPVSGEATGITIANSHIDGAAGTATDVLVAGTYYVRVAPSSGGSSGYALSLKAEAMPEIAGSGFADAHDFGSNPSLVTVSEQVSASSTATNLDYYRFSLTSATYVEFGLTSSGVADLDLLNANGASVASGLYSDDNTDMYYGRTLTAGDYYVRVSGYYASQVVDYTLSINPVTLSVGNVTLVEGNSGTTSAVFTLTLSSNQSEVPVTVGYTTADGSAKAGIDYAATSGTVTFAPGQTTATVSVAVTGETLYETAEGFSLVLSPPSGASLSGGGSTLSATGTITNDDAPPVISMAAVNVTEGNSGTANMVFTVKLSAASAVATTVKYATSNGTAKSGSDYNAASGTLTIAAGATSGTISVGIKGDTLYEANETLSLVLSAPTDATLSGGGSTLSATGTIKNNDAAPVASISNATVTEGNSGSVTLTYTVSLSAASGAATTIAYATANGLATAGSDFTAKSGTLTIAAGATSGTISVTVAGDTLYEADETLSLVLSSPSGATFTGGASTLSAIGTIANDDVAPVASIAAATLAEGNSGSATMSFTVTLSAASGRATTISYATADGTAKAGADYTATSGTLTIAAGATSGVITVPVIGDTVYESNESFSLVLSAPDGASLSGGGPTLAAAGTITNDDALPVISLAGASVAEGNSGTATALFTVTLSAASEVATTIAYATADGTGVAGSDYTATTGTLTIAAGATSGTISVPVTGDTSYEPNETFSLVLSSPTGATFSGGGATLSATGTITNDDAPPVATMANVSVTEGNSGTKNATFTVTLSAVSATSTTFSYATSNNSALSSSDYNAASGTLTIAAGSKTGTINVAVRGDTRYEANEAFYLTLSNANGATFSGGASTLRATGTITNDDAKPVLSIGNVTLAEGNSGTVNAVFTVTLSAASNLATTVSYTTANGTATAGSDYTAISGTLTIAAGATTGTISVPVTGDVVSEPTETFSLTLSSPTNANLFGGGSTLTATGTITNDDATPQVAGIDKTLTTGASTALNSLFSVTLASGDSVVTYQVMDTTATAGSGTISINGSTQAAGTPVTLTPAQLATTTFVAGTASGQDTIFVRAANAGGYSAWGAANVTTVAAGAPTVTTTDTSVSGTTAVSSLFTVASTGGTPITAYQFIDLSPEATSGKFSVGGTAQSAGSTIDVMASALSSVSFVAGAAGSTDNLWVRASNGTNWSSWSSFNATSSLAA
ncbi:pre-peptidase C-terminal domain-containing protein [Ancylobacter sonchi]|uniref:beta strand repeat-containing protein n=1 Tax=Ancylobacter sonchi TaxID=1937790 RepID=UPI001BD2D275|nr:Calx-beta domain-containing protein [Ancylobacter sonchi]MBS7533757.1 pre-peptidase C-terminal domain-containing protein [Ancylobacter sonchi]